MEYPGIYHAIIHDEIQGEQSRALAQHVVHKGLSGKQYSAKGATLFSKKKQSILPLIYVEATDTEVWESSCGTASAALATYLAYKHTEDIEISIAQPSGNYIWARVTCCNGIINNVNIEEDVYLSSIGIAFHLIILREPKMTLKRDQTNALLRQLDVFIQKFSKLNRDFQNGICVPDEAEKVLGDYTAFILEPENKRIWDQYVQADIPEIQGRVVNAQRESAHCVWAMEKYRAMALISTGDGPAEYFKNIEGCIEDEFGHFQANENSKILMIGVGAFPMTPLLIARNTGAKVVGIDIDEDAVAYAKKVIEILGQGLDIEVCSDHYSELNFTKEATHIIFASTIAEKYDILKDLYALTNQDTVVIMRYGNGFKSLFNYPLVDMTEELWRKVEIVYCEGNVFDVALYKK